MVWLVPARLVLYFRMRTQWKRARSRPDWWLGCEGGRASARRSVADEKTSVAPDPAAWRRLRDGAAPYPPAIERSRESDSGRCEARAIACVDELSNCRTARRYGRRTGPGDACRPLRFRNGLVLFTARRRASVSVFEMFANACYRRQFTSREPAARSSTSARTSARSRSTAPRDFLPPGLRPMSPTRAPIRMPAENIAANHLESRVHAYPEAVGRAVGVLDLWGSANSITATAYPHATETQDCLRPSVRWSISGTVVARAGGTTGLVKLDAEGAEADIIEGGQRQSSVRSRNLSANTTKIAFRMWWRGAGPHSSNQDSPSRSPAAGGADRCSARGGSTEAAADDRALVCGCAEPAARARDGASRAPETWEVTVAAPSRLRGDLRAIDLEPIADEA